MTTGSISRSGTATFARRVAGTFGVRLLITGSSLLTGIIIARWLGSGAVGVWATINVVTLLAVTLAGFGLPSAITYFVARDVSRSRAVLTASLGFAIAAGIIVAGVLIVAVEARPQLFGNVSPELIKIAALSLPFQMASYFCLAANLGLERIRVYNAIDFSIQVSMLLNAAIMVVALGLGLRELVTSSAIINVLLSFVIVGISLRAVRSAEVGISNGKLLREMLGTGSRFFIVLLAGMVILRGDLLIVNYYRSAAEAGVYAVATQASLFLHMIPNVISTILFPRTSGDQERSAEMTCRVTRHAFFLMILLSVVAAPFSFLLPVLYGPDFSGVPAIFILLLPGVFLLGIETIQVQHFSGSGLPRQIPIFWIIATIFCIGLDLIFVPQYGITAAAIVSTVTYGLVFVLVASLFRSKTGLSFSEAFILRRDELRDIFKMGRTAPATSES